MPAEPDRKKTKALPPAQQAAFIGDRHGPLARRLTALGVPLDGGLLAALTIVDGDTLTVTTSATAQAALQDAHDRGANVLWCFGQTNTFPRPEVELTDRRASLLVPDVTHAWTKCFTLPDLYFAEDDADRFIMKHGLTGSLVARGRVLLRAGETDWALFNNAPEKAKCAAVLLD